jgi:hypothetical protein
VKNGGGSKSMLAVKRIAAIRPDHGAREIERGKAAVIATSMMALLRETNEQPLRR